MIISTVLFPLVAATFEGLTVAWLKRLPTLHMCPTCAHRTQAVLLPGLLRPLQRWISRRWCPDCEWEGVGRKGPEFIPGRPLAHDSGFHWGADVMGENAGFHWAQLEPPAPLDPSADPPAHRSGFRFGGAPSRPGSEPSAFNWSSPGPTAPDADDDARRLAFPWGGRRHESEAFVWRQRHAPLGRGKAGPNDKARLKNEAGPERGTDVEPERRSKPRRTDLLGEFEWVSLSFGNPRSPSSP